MKSATDQVTKSFTTLATKRAVAADLATAVRSQGDEWKKAGAAIKDYVSKTKNTK
jgi:hypothetical protein